MNIWLRSVFGVVDVVDGNIWMYSWIACLGRIIIATRHGVCACARAVCCCRCYFCDLFLNSDYVQVLFCPMFELFDYFIVYIDIRLILEVAMHCYTVRSALAFPCNRVLSLAIIGVDGHFHRFSTLVRCFDLCIWAGRFRDCTPIQNLPKEEGLFS